ncbi:MAG: hypothetical protein ACRYGP_06775 [Janthinobacterium lividum]
MPGAENDVAVLVRLRAAKAAASAARQGREVRSEDHAAREALARARWPASIALLRSLAEQYRRRSADLGIVIEVEETVRLRSWIPDVSVHVARSDRQLATDLIFRMTADGRTFCRVQQTRGRRQANLNREDRPIQMSDLDLRPLLRAVVQILILH